MKKSDIQIVWMLMHAKLGLQEVFVDKRVAEARLLTRNYHHFQLFKERPYTLTKHKVTHAA